MGPTSSHQHACDFTGFGKLRYLYFTVAGSGSSRAVWSGQDGTVVGNNELVLPERRLVIRRVQMNIDEAVTVIGGSGTKSIRLDLIQPPSVTGTSTTIASTSALTKNAKLGDPLVDLYQDQLDSFRPEIRFQANAAVGTPTGWTGTIRCRIGYQFVHNFGNIPDQS